MNLGDLTVRRVGFGAMRLTGTAPFHRGEPRDREQSLRVLRRAVELGVDHIDTAAFYFSQLRSANELINSALQPYPDDLVIVTKVGPYRDITGEWAEMGRPDQLRGQVEENLRQLGRDHLDVVNLRVRKGQTTIAEHFGALAQLQTEGLIRHLGLSGVTTAQLAEAQVIAPVVCVQNAYGLDRRDSEDVLRVCGEQGIAFVPFFAVAGKGGERGVAGRADGEAIQAVAESHGVTVAQVRLAWTLHRGPHVLAIPGTSSVSHLEQNVAAGEIQLTPADLELLGE